MLTASGSKNTSVVNAYGSSSSLTSSKPIRRPRSPLPRSIGTGHRSSTAWLKTAAQRLRASVTLIEVTYGVYVAYASRSTPLPRAAHRGTSPFVAPDVDTAPTRAPSTAARTRLERRPHSSSMIDVDDLVAGVDLPERIQR